jgi:glycosyltransferase involved in cell wall biosynthesis
MSTYNGEKYLQEQLDSLIALEGIELYLLIRDDGSTDATINIIKECSLFKNNESAELILGENIGCTYSFRELLISAKRYINIVEYFAFCDQDDIWLKNKLKIATNKLRKMSSDTPAMYCSNLTLIDENKKFIRELRKKGSVGYSKASSLVESIATGCTMVFNKTTITYFNRYLPTRMTIHDLWIYQMCLFLGEVFYDDNSYVLYRQHQNNEIGAKYSFTKRWKSRYISIKTLPLQHFREMEAQELLCRYSTLLSKEDKQLISIVANYKDTLNARIRFILHMNNKDLRMKAPGLNIWLKIRILLGYV